MSQEQHSIPEQETEQIAKVAPYPKVSFLIEAPYARLKEIVDTAPIRLDDTLNLVAHKVIIEVIPRDLESFRRLSIWATSLLASNKVYAIHSIKAFREL